MLSVLLALLLLHAPPQFSVRFSPGVSFPGHPVVMTAEYTGPLVEENYCLGYDVSWPNGTHSTSQQDCELPFPDYVKALADQENCETMVVVVPPGFDADWGCVQVTRVDTRWTWSFRAPTSSVTVDVRFLKPNKKSVLIQARLIVPSEE